MCTLVSCLVCFSKARQALQRGLLSDSESEGEDLADIFGGKKKEEKSSFEERQEKVE